MFIRPLSAGHVIRWPRDPYNVLKHCESLMARAIHAWKPDPGFPLKCGLEIHTQLMTSSKLFSRSRNSPLAAPNQNVSFFDLGIPGTFPKLNPEALLLALRAAAVLKSRPSPVSSFDRKHYFYLDQPMGYQITQHFRPLAKGGYLQLSREYDDVEEDKVISIEQIQLEQDTAKLNYDAYDRIITTDFNRANVPLIELVTKPDFSHLRQVRAFVKKYISIMTHLGICSGDMENGAMRCDVNVSVAGGNRVEIKNLGSTTEIAAAVTYEYGRQVQELKDGAKIIPQETRSWDGLKTIRTRSKEDAIDYRYFPDMELPLVHLKDSIVDEILGSLPELPEQMVKRLTEKPYSLELKHAKFLVDSPDLFRFYTKVHQTVVIEKNQPARTVNNWFIHELMGALKKHDLPAEQDIISPSQLAEIICMVTEKQISKTSAKLVLSLLIQDSEETQNHTISELVEMYDLQIPQDIAADDLDTAIEAICQEVIEAHPQVEQTIRDGNPKAIKFLVGQAMRETQGKVSANQFEITFNKLLL